MKKLRNEIKILFFGSSRVSRYVSEELEQEGYKLKMVPEGATVDDLKKEEWDIFIVAAYGKILSPEILQIPTFGALNVHPSLLPKLRGSSPIQNIILGAGQPGVTIIKMDEEVDHGPIIAQEKVEVLPFPDHYATVEEKLARVGGKLLAAKLEPWINGEIGAAEQDHDQVTFVKKITKEDGLLNLSDDPQINLRKTLAYSTWPGAYFFFRTKGGKNLRIVVKEAEIKDGKYTPTKVVPEGKKEMVWEDFLRGNA